MSREQDLDAGVRRSMDRRRFLGRAAAGSLIVASGLGCGRLVEDEKTRAAAALVPNTSAISVKGTPKPSCNTKATR